ncbi:MAG: diacylglycerol kinase family protein [Vicinamibacterales bacterium]
MKVSLLHNEKAGSSVTLNEIADAIERHGHDIIAVVERHDDQDELLDPGSELIVVAGGDGTIASAARVLAGQDQPPPLAILPIGTANNIASSLRIVGPLTELVGRWDAARRMPLDIGVASGDWGRRYFVEAVGGGLIPAGIRMVQSRKADEHGDPSDKVERAQALFRDVLDTLEPSHLTIDMDGTTLTGRFLIVEVLNIKSVGPNLDLCSDANPSDGYFAVVVAAESDRSLVDDYLRHLAESSEARLRLPVHRARKVTIQGLPAMHLDDRVVTLDESAAVSMTIIEGALEVLV